MIYKLKFNLASWVEDGGRGKLNIKKKQFYLNKNSQIFSYHPYLKRDLLSCLSFLKSSQITPQPPSQHQMAISLRNLTNGQHLLNNDQQTEHFKMLDQYWEKRTWYDLTLKIRWQFLYEFRIIKKVYFYLIIIQSI